MIRFLTLLLFCSAASAQPWHKVGTVKGLVAGNYTPVVIMPTGITVWNNSEGAWWQQSGTWTKVGTPARSLSAEQIYDEWPCAGWYCAGATLNSPIW